jgi:hypothetical protein
VNWVGDHSTTVSKRLSVPPGNGTKTTQTVTNRRIYTAETRRAQRQIKKKTFFAYNDSYPTCARTYATLCIYLPDASDPNAVSEKFGIQPTRTQVKGEIRNGKTKRWPTAWFLGTTEKVQSKDVRRHVDWLLDQLEDKSEIIRQLQESGSEIHISCFWESAIGQGGPMLDPVILKRIAKLNIGIIFDVY